MTEWPYTTALVILLSYPLATTAEVQETVTIKGTVYAAVPCVINDDKPITASFGDVQTAGIDGNYKTINLDYTLNCSRSTTNELRMQVRGEAAFDTALLRVQGYDNLGVALKKDGTRFALNTWSDFDTHRQPLLQAVLVKSGLGEIKAGAFRASATLLVEYR